jgi:hypothetical protein
MSEQEQLWVLVDPERGEFSVEQWADAVGRLSDLFDIARLFGAEPNEALLFALRDARVRAEIALERASEGESV